LYENVVQADVKRRCSYDVVGFPLSRGGGVADDIVQRNSEKNDVDNTPKMVVARARIGRTGRDHREQTKDHADEQKFPMS